MDTAVKIRQEKRKTLAMRLVPGGIEVRIPDDLDPESERVQAFIVDGLAKLDAAGNGYEPAERTAEELLATVDGWGEKLAVNVNRVQVRPMRQKWASMSSNGNLTLSDDLLSMAAELVDYVIVHELLHLKIPDHGRGFQAMLSAWLPDWEERERILSYQHDNTNS